MKEIKTQEKSNVMDESCYRLAEIIEACDRIESQGNIFSFGNELSRGQMVWVIDESESCYKVLFENSGWVQKKYITVDNDFELK
ncbi:hypothetical protein [Pleionea sediminis]|uniref:hypothetical protein n=1 Tax=Pleionea sediminis TaxID=2569479 RepID=UPI001186CC1A|nr:hypothetical protein [Pleionea sediminis]